MLQPTDDGELAAQALGGDRVAFARLLERHYDLVYRVAYRYVGSAADAEDIAQNVCLALATKLGHFRGRSRFTTWLCAITINACRDYLRRRKSSEKLIDRYVVQRAEDEADQADDARRAAWLQEALERLEPNLQGDRSPRRRRGDVACGGGGSAGLRRKHRLLAHAYGEEAAARRYGQCR